MKGFLSLLVASVFLLPSIGEAQRNSRREREAFEQLQTADAAYQEQDYQTALRHLRAAWSLFEAPVIRFNQGKTFEAMERWHDAADAYEDYLALDPEADSHEELEARVTELRSRCPRGPCAEAEQAPSEQPSLPDVENEDVEESGAPVLPVSLMSVGGVAALGGVVAWALAAGDKGRLSDESTPMDELPGIEDRARRRATLGNVLVPLGASLVVAGVVWLIVRGRRDSALSADAAGVSVRF